MRIPPSVIVMSVVTAVPFGLGVRDTLRQKDVSVEEFGELGYERDRDRAYEEYEAERRREELEREAKSAERIAKLDQLFGAKPAQVGALFDGIVLGTGAGSFQPEDVRRRIENATRDGFITVQFDADAKSLNGIDVQINSDYDTSDACEQFSEKLVAKWGSATNGAWLDAQTHQRASFDEDSCELRFERYLDPADWVAQLPLSAVGTSVEKLTRSLGDYDDSDPSHVVWSGPGTGYGAGPTRYDAYHVNGKVIWIRASADADFDTTLAVRDAISAKLKAQPKTSNDDYAQLYTWKKRVQLETSDDERFHLSIGNTWD